VALALCATGWFTAGTAAGNFRAVAALWTSYLAILACRKMADWPPQRQRRARSTGLSPAKMAARTRWLTLLAWRASECAIYAGLAAGAAAHQQSVWALAVAVAGLTAVRDLMMVMTGRAGLAEADEPEHGLLRRATETLLAMPPGGRVLLIGIVAPAWGGRVTLLALLYWGILAIGYGLISHPWPMLARGESAAEADEVPGRDRGTGADFRDWLTAPFRRAPAPTSQVIEHGEQLSNRRGQPVGGYGPPGPVAPGSLVYLLRPDWEDEDGEPDGLPNSAAEPAPELAADDADTVVLGGGGRDIATPAAELLSPPAASTAPADGEVASAEVAGAVLAEETEAALAEVAEARESARQSDAAASTPEAGLVDDAEPVAANRLAAARIVRLRDDGVVARRIGRPVRGSLLPLPPAVLGLAATAIMAYLGLHSLPGILIMTPPLIMLLLAALGSSNPHTGRLDWLVPPVLLGWQFLYLGAIGSAGGVPGPVVFTLCAVLVLWYADLAFPGRPVILAQPMTPGEQHRDRGSALGWDGRMLLMGAGVALGIGMYAYLALAAYVGALIGAKVLASCLATPEKAR